MSRIEEARERAKIGKATITDIELLRFAAVDALKQNLVEVKSYWLSAERKNKRLTAKVVRLEALNKKAEDKIKALKESEKAKFQALSDMEGKEEKDEATE